MATLEEVVVIGHTPGEKPRDSGGVIVIPGNPGLLGGGGNLGGGGDLGGQVPGLDPITVIGFVGNPAPPRSRPPPVNPSPLPYRARPAPTPPPKPPPAPSPRYQPPTDVPIVNPGDGIDPGEYLDQFQGKPLPGPAAKPMLPQLEVSAPRGGNAFGLAFAATAIIIALIDRYNRPATKAEKAKRSRIKYPLPFTYGLPDIVPSLDFPPADFPDIQEPQLDPLTVTAPREVTFYPDENPGARRESGVPPQTPYEFISHSPVTTSPAGHPRSIPIGNPNPRPAARPGKSPNPFVSPATGPAARPGSRVGTPARPGHPLPPPQGLTGVNTPPVGSTRPIPSPKPQPPKKPPKPPAPVTTKDDTSSPTPGGPGGGDAAPGPGGGGGSSKCLCPSKKTPEQKKKYGCEQGYYRETKDGITYKKWSTRKCQSSKTSSPSQRRGAATIS